MKKEKPTRCRLSLRLPHCGVTNVDFNFIILFSSNFFFVSYIIKYRSLMKKNHFNNIIIIIILYNNIFIFVI